MRPDWWTFGLQVLNFAILVWLLRRFLYRPVLAMIDARKAAILKQTDEVQAARDQAQALLKSAQDERAGIAAERDKVLKAAAQRAQDLVDARLAQAETEARARIDASRAALATEREAALTEARRLALDLGADFARRLLAEIPERLRAEGWLEHIETRLATLPADERAALAGQLANGDTLRVVTASPLPAETATAWQTRLATALDARPKIAFAVDTALIAGAELHFPTSILRFSWQSGLQDLRDEGSGHVHAD